MFQEPKKFLRERLFIYQNLGLVAHSGPVQNLFRFLSTLVTDNSTHFSTRQSLSFLEQQIYLDIFLD